jgi:5'-3' exonuclease
MILLVDADSLIFASCYSNDKQAQFYEDIEDAINKFDQQFMKIVNDLEDRFEIEKVITFNGSKGNFRKKITPVYKANRKKQDLPPLLHNMHEYVKKQYNSVYGYGLETDDLVSKYWFTLSKEIGRENVMIVSIDKDYKQFPALIYNYHYNHREIIDVTPKEAMFNFYSQCIIGDSADNVQFFKGKGIKFAEKYYKGCETKYQYTRRLYELFKEKYKSKARQKYVECYNLLKLREQ